MTSFSRGMLAIAAVTAITFGWTGCAQPANEKEGETAMTDTMASGTQANKDIARQFVDEVFNKGNMAFLDEHVAADFVEHSPSPGQEPGVEGFKKMVTQWREAMPDSKATVENIIGDGDLVAIHTHQTGTVQNAMFGPGTQGKHIDISGIDLVRIKDGKMTEHWGYYEEAKMFQQLGLMPPMDGEMPPMDGAMKDTTK